MAEIRTVYTKITPKQRRADRQSLQSEYDSIGKEQNKTEGERNLM